MQSTKVPITPGTVHSSGNVSINVLGKRPQVTGTCGGTALQPASKRVKVSHVTLSSSQSSVNTTFTVEKQLSTVINIMTKKSSVEESHNSKDIWYVINRGCLLPFTEEYQSMIEAAFCTKDVSVTMDVTDQGSPTGVTVYINFGTNSIKLPGDNEVRRIVRNIDFGDFCSPHATSNRFNVDTPVMVYYPAEWEPQALSCELKTLAIDNPERTRIVQKLKETGICCVEKVERIQNQHLWKRYFLEREFVKEKNGGIANEMELFHGTRSTPPEMIYNGEEGFDMRYSNLGCWGKGIYFADSAAYSYRYSYVDTALRKVQILMCRVTIGDAFSCPDGDRKLVTPPRKQSTSQTSSPDNLYNLPSEPRVSFAVNFYDSVVGKQGRDTIRTVYNNSKAYPAYLITIQLT